MRRGIFSAIGMAAVFLTPLVAYGADSENYGVNQQLNAGGGASSSGQYQTFGVIDYYPSDVTGADVPATLGSGCDDCGQFEPTEEFEVTTPNPGGGDTPDPAGVGGGDADPSSTATPGTTGQADTVLQAALQAVAAAWAGIVGVLSSLSAAALGVLTGITETISLNEALALATIASTLALAAAPFAAGLGSAAPAAQPLAYAFNFLFGWAKRRRGYGRVYDAATRKPISGATVRLLSEGGQDRFAAGKLLATTTSDANGHYYFLVQPGAYRIEVVAPDFAFPSTASSLDYHGEHVALKEAGSLHPDIPLDGRTVAAMGARQALVRLGRWIQWFRLPLMALGSVSGLYFGLTRGTVIDYLTLGGYVFLWTLEFLSWRRVSGDAKVLAAGKPVDSAIVRLYAAEDELLNTVVSEPNGRFALFAPAGEYRMVVTKTGYVPEEWPVKLGYASQIYGTVRLRAV